MAYACSTQRTRISQITRRSLSMDFDELLANAKNAATNTVVSNKTIVGRVGVAALTHKKMYIGSSLSLGCSLGFCAEAAVVGEMIRNKDYIIKMLVAYHCEDGIVSPCGKCREMLYQLHPENLKCKVLLNNRVVTLEKLLPEYYP